MPSQGMDQFIDDENIEFLGYRFRDDAPRTDQCLHHRTGKSDKRQHPAEVLLALINPILDNRDQNNTHIHAITPEMVADAPTFAQLFPQSVQFIGELPIVCHNRGADINIMQRCMNHYGLTGIDTANTCGIF